MSSCTPVIISPVIAAKIDNKMMHIDLSVGNEKKTVNTSALLDSGAGGVFIDSEFVKEYRMPLKEIYFPVRVFNVDGTTNKRGTITHCTWATVTINGQKARTRFLVTGLGKETVILGLPWLRKVNPKIDWEKGTIDLNLVKPNLQERFKKACGNFHNKWQTNLNANSILLQDRFKNACWRFRLNSYKNTISLQDRFKNACRQFRLKKQDTPTPMDEQENPINTDSQDTEPLKEAKDDLLKEEKPDTLETEDDLLMAYMNGELRPEPPLTEEELTPRFKIKRKGPTIGRITTSLHGKMYSYGQNTWIQAKTSVSQELAHKYDGQEPQRIKTLEEMVPEEYHEFLSVFEKKALERFPESRHWDHEITLKEPFIAKDCKIYPLNPLEQAKQDEFIDEHLRKGYIRPSKSPQASPFFFISKKEKGQLRPCQDYRYLNKNTVKNTYPLPLVGDLMDKLKGAKVFSKFDIRWGYNNIRIKDGDQWKAAFKTNRGLFEPMVMFFGLCNSPATFQNMMNELFRDYLDEGWVVIYMDDILIFSDNLDEHKLRTKRILERLKKNDLYLKPEKCSFEVPQIDYLGMVISKNKIAMDPAKLSGIRDWPTPLTVKEVRSFLGFGNFYRKFISHYSEIARPLNDLTKKNLVWKWSEECQKGFDTC